MNSPRTEALIRTYFTENSFVTSDIESFNNFVENELQAIIEENKEVEPTILPSNIDEFKIRLDRIWVTKPEITEADGSRRQLLPMEARLRKISYAAPIFIEISAHINGIQRESFKTQVGQLPIMLNSKQCHLHGLTREELITSGEDPDDTGGYFIINGTEKVLIKIEDLAANVLNVEKATTGISEYVGKIFSEKGSYKIPHTIEKLKDGIFYLTFTRVKRIPIVLVFKALGLTDQQIVQHLGLQDNGELVVNLYDQADIKTAEDAQDAIAKKIGITQTREIRVERIQDILDKYLLPHIGMDTELREEKAINLAKNLRQFILTADGQLEVNDKDHYKNKRLKLSGDLLGDLFRVNLKVLIGDMLYNFQRIVKRGKFPSIKVIIRDKLLTQRIYSAMATGAWIGGRKGVSQRMDRMNQLATLSHLQRVVSPLSATQENFAARALHSTHLGRLCPTETPEGSNIGLKKNLALLASVTQKVDNAVVIAKLKELGLQDSALAMPAEVYVDNRFVGGIGDPNEFCEAIRAERRIGKLPRDVNVVYDEDTKSVKVETASGRVVRPLLIVRQGKLLLTDRHIDQLNKNEIAWDDLVSQGVIEYLDAAEEEGSLVGFFADKLTPNHTHVEIAPMSIVGLCTSLVPFGQHNHGVRNAQGSKNQKQAVGFYAANFYTRMDQDLSLLFYPQVPLVATIMHELSDYNKHPSGQNVTIAVLSYEGYNMEDALVVNKGSIERGFGRSAYFKPVDTEELRYSGGLIDQVGIPDKETKGYKTEHEYRLLEDDGIIFPEAQLGERDVVIGKTSPPRFLSALDEYNLAGNARRESSVALKHGEHGIVDFVLLTENEEGNKLIQVRLRDHRTPEIGDKFTSRHGQKGVIGLIVPEADVPFTSSGIKPDVIFGPHGLPSRMTVSHMVELLGGKVSSLSGRIVDGTLFEGDHEPDLREELAGHGFESSGLETMYNAITGEQFHARVMVGNMYYMRLKHMVANKLHSRARGPIQLLTRQPTEGRAKEGGLRLGEMEKDTFVAHGASLLLKERFDSDRTVVPVCTKSGLLGYYDARKRRLMSPVYGEDSEVEYVEMSYAFKLMLDELKGLGVYPRILLEDKY